MTNGAVLWTDVEDEFSAAGVTVRLGVPAGLLPVAERGLADHAVGFKEGQPVADGVGFSLYDIMFFETLSQNFAPRRIVVRSDDFGWNVACLRRLFPHATLGGQEEIGVADLIVISGPADAEVLEVEIGLLGSCGDAWPTVIVWNAARDGHWPAFDAAARTWPGETVALWRTSGCAGVLAGAALPPRALSVIRAFAGAGPWAVDGPAAGGPEAPLFQRLIALYQAQGFDVMVGIENRNHDLRKDTELATLFTGDPAAPEYCDIGQGIAVTELYFFECLARVFQPRNILIIGSAFGWSTLGLGLIFPGARVVALDNLSLGGEVAMGIDLTRRIARDAGLNVTVVEGASPGDVAGAVNDHLDGPVDLAFIDGLDTEVQQALDFAAVRDVLATSSVIAFHHVLLLNLLSGFRAIQQDWQGGGGLMTRTPSGMGCLYSAVLERTVGTVVSAFTDPTIDVPVPK
tara:strand:+ start:26449 stop:27825 length:1377 start_codon:yes stop_codon:yes gene_type:complete